MSIEKSPVVRQQEEKIAALQAEIKKKTSTIKSLKTRLNNMRERISELQRKASSSFASAKQKMQEQTEKIIAILARLQKDKRFSKDDRAQFKEMHQEIDGMLEEAQHFGDPEFDYEHDGSEGERAQNFDPFAEFQVAPEPEVQQDLRKIYLKLSKRFHPDRAQNAKEQALFHDIQQEIVRLYQTHDLQGLMNLAMQYDLDLLDFSESETDVLEQKIQLLTQQLSGLEQQQERLSGEIKNLRDSPLGQMLTDVDSYAKEGLDITNAAEMTGDALEEMQIYYEVLEEVERTASMEPLIEHQNALMEDDLIAELLFGDSDDFDDYYEGNENYDYNPFGEDFPEIKEATDPQYPVGSWVEFEIIGHQPRKLILVKGQVIKALLFPSGEVVYDVSASTETLQKLPPDVFEKMVELDSLGTFKGIPEDMISSDKAPSKEKIAAREEMLYKIWRKYAFQHLSAAQRKRIFKILDRNPEKLDHENWLDHIREEIICPFRARVYEADEVIPENAPFEENYSQREISVEVIGFTQNADTISIKAITKDREKRERIFFLHDLLPNMIHYRKLIDDYMEWHERYVETFLDL
jgi:predicted  nucleic acid-binding Zn-ribbon protein